MDNELKPLLPCPFCGEKPPEQVDEGQDIWIIECKNHRDDITFRAYGNGPDEAADNWNTRLSSPERKRALEEIESKIYDVFHNMSLPSMSGKSLGELHEYARAVIMPAVRQSLQQEE